MGKPGSAVTNKAVALILAAGLLVFGGWYVFAGNESSGQMDEPSGITKPGKTVTITLSDEGFTPSNVVIDKGDMVTWVNKSDHDMRVAVGPHPDHSAYPEFDQMTTGDEFSFVFDKAGGWSYHNHEDTRDIGLVIVRGQSKTDYPGSSAGDSNHSH